MCSIGILLPSIAQSQIVINPSGSGGGSFSVICADSSTEEILFNNAGTCDGNVALKFVVSDLSLALTDDGTPFYDYPVTIEKTITTYDIIFQSEAFLNPTVNGSNGIYGYSGLVYHNSAFNAGSDIVAGRFSANRGTGANDSTTGGLEGVSSGVNNFESLGSITGAVYAYRVRNLSNSGTITGATYGYYVGDITAGTQTGGAFSFYSSDTGAINRFGGNSRFQQQYYNETFFDNGNSGASDTINWNEGNVQLSTLTDNVTYTFSNPISTGRYVLKIIQDVGGTNTVAFPGTVMWPGGVAPTITATGDAIDVCTFLWDGTNYFGSCAQDFSVP